MRLHVTSKGTESMKEICTQETAVLVTVVITYGENIIWFHIYWPFAHSSDSLRWRTYKRTLYKVNNYPDSSESFPLFLGVFTLHELASDTCEYRLLQRVLYTLNNCFVCKIIPDTFEYYVLQLFRVTTAHPPTLCCRCGARTCAQIRAPPQHHAEHMTYIMI